MSCVNSSPYFCLTELIPFTLLWEISHLKWSILKSSSVPVLHRTSGHGTTCTACWSPVSSLPIRTPRALDTGWRITARTLCPSVTPAGRSSATTRRRSMWPNYGESPQLVSLLNQICKICSFALMQKVSMQDVQINFGQNTDDDVVVSFICDCDFFVVLFIYFNQWRNQLGVNNSRLVATLNHFAIICPLRSAAVAKLTYFCILKEFV